MTDTSPVEAVADLPCLKCGSDETAMTYCDGCELRPSHVIIGRHADDQCAHGDLEHMHRCCRRCSYRWRTDDVVNPRKVCSK